MVTNFWSSLRPNGHHSWIQKVSKPLFPYKICPFWTQSDSEEKKILLQGHTASWHALQVIVIYINHYRKKENVIFTLMGVIPQKIRPSLMACLVQPKN